MKNQNLVLIVAVLAVMALSNIAGVVAYGDLDADIQQVNIDGIEVYSGYQHYVVVGGIAGDVVPVQIRFISYVDAKDARIKVWIAGYRDEIAKSTKRMNLVEGSTYSELLSLKLPSDIDPSEDYSLYVRIETQDGYSEEEYHLRVQRDSYQVDILDIDAEKTANVGSNYALDIVLKNTGFEKMNDLFVVASIPELGISKKVYFEDLLPVDGCEIGDDLDDEDVIEILKSDCDRRDSAERMLYLRIPGNAKTGTYTLEVEAYNADYSEKKTMSVAIVGGEQDTQVLAPIKSKDVAVGQTTNYDIVIVNSGNKVGIYDIAVESAEGVTLSVATPYVTVPAGSTEVVKVTAKGVSQGNRAFSVNVNSNGQSVSKVTFNANVTSKKVFSGNTAILTVILAITFIVLLVVLIVLLTRKPSKTEELEESYY